jgi:ammonia channel protein AmtB
MRLSKYALTLSLVAVLGAWAQRPAQAVELTVYLNQATETGVRELAAGFEKATGNKVNVSFQAGNALNEKIVSGAVAGLGTITPASGYVLPWHGIVIGIVAGAICFYACTALKARFKYDDSLDVFGVHGIGGITGTLLCGVFATAAVSVAPDVPQGYSGLLEGNYQQLMIQLFGVAVTMAWSGGMTVVLLKAVAAVTALRATQDEEREGLDISIHGEAIQ